MDADEDDGDENDEDPELVDPELEYLDPNAEEEAWKVDRQLRRIQREANR